MKKFLALLLVISTIIVMIPAFAVSAETADEAPTMEEAIKGKEKLTPYTGYSDTYEGFATISQGAQINTGECSFLDGNVYFDKANAKTLMSGITPNEVIAYVDGRLAEMNPNHSRLLVDNGIPRGYGGGYMFSIYNADLVKGQDAVVTLVFGNTGYYTQFTINSHITTLSYDSAEVMIKGSNATITVNGGTVAEKYSLNETVKVRVHDDHNDRMFTVTEKEGDTVVFTCTSFTSTTKTLFEVGYSSDANAKAFSVTLDPANNKPGGTVPAPSGENDFAVAIQSRDGDLAGNDWRFLFTATPEVLASVLDTGAAKVIFNKGDAVVKTFTMSFANDATFLREVTANGEYWYPSEGYVLFGFIISDVPAFAWSSFTVQVVNGEDVLYEATNSKSIAETVAMGGYIWLNGEKNIQAFGGTAESPVSGDTINRPGNGEGLHNLFDKTASKFGAGDSQGNKGNITVTWNYDDAKTVSLYAIYTGNDSRGNNYNRNPLSWVLYGSNDGKEYVVIDTVDDPALPNEGGQGKYYVVDEPTPYQYYKIEFVTNSGKYFQLGEIKMLETATDIEYNFNDIINGATNLWSDPAPTHAHEGLDQLFDNNSGTKFGYYEGTNKVTVTWAYSSAKTATGYSITTANDSTYENRNPKGWILYGSVDGKVYVELDKVAVSDNFSNEMAIYGIDNPGSYQFYKIEFSVNNHEFQMADIALYN